ncbi:Metallopeptidase, catalytic domain protein [Metarhizium album ARSEF 1941]|uniref:Metallopeptidase, catalytic domain protein n=1 Tax=Metarhizium album (strain ARSEF 1941) TaxID=1081103 RepID=A0A0B2X3A3_METAS|nr:Metallopeptidase, catalytic domain protein [Metarhizium album ARSEF 1941]KHO00223.1 Metallopeptidase, catalytic domain protein [Metarhizium album ARSEF 1941]
MVMSLAFLLGLMASASVASPLAVRDGAEHRCGAREISLTERQLGPGQGSPGEGQGVNDDGKNITMGTYIYFCPSRCGKFPPDKSGQDEIERINVAFQGSITFKLTKITHVEDPRCSSGLVNENDIDSLKEKIYLGNVGDAHILYVDTNQGAGVKGVALMPTSGMDIAASIQRKDGAAVAMDTLPGYNEFCSGGRNRARGLSESFLGRLLRRQGGGDKGGALEGSSITAAHELAHTLGMAHLGGNQKRQLGGGVRNIMEPEAVFSAMYAFNSGQLKEMRKMADKALWVRPVDKALKVRSVDKILKVRPVDKILKVRPADKALKVRPVDKALKVRSVDKILKVQSVDKALKVQSVDKILKVRPVDKALQFQPEGVTAPNFQVTALNPRMEYKALDFQTKEMTTAVRGDPAPADPPSPDPAPLRPLGENSGAPQNPGGVLRPIGSEPGLNDGPSQPQLESPGNNGLQGLGSGKPIGFGPGLNDGPSQPQLESPGDNGLQEPSFGKPIGFGPSLNDGPSQPQLESPGNNGLQGLGSGEPIGFGPSLNDGPSQPQLESPGNNGLQELGFGEPNGFGPGLDDGLSQSQQATSGGYGQEGPVLWEPAESAPDMGDFMALYSPGPDELAPRADSPGSDGTNDFSEFISNNFHVRAQPEEEANESDLVHINRRDGAETAPDEPALVHINRRDGAETATDEPALVHINRRDGAKTATDEPALVHIN